MTAASLPCNEELHRLRMCQFSYFLVFCLFFRVIFVQQGRPFSFFRYSAMNFKMGTLFFLSYRYRRHVKKRKKNKKIKPCVPLQAWMFPPFCFQEELHFRPIGLPLCSPHQRLFPQHPCRLAACSTNQT